jgi:hypothetical protein
MNVKVISTAGAILAVVGVMSVSYISAYNSGNNLENLIESRYVDNQNILSQYSQKVQEAAQIPGMRAEDLKGILKEAFSSNSGNATQAIFGLGQAQGVTASDETYIQVQRIIEAGRNDFQQAQTQLIDVVRQYKTQLGSFWRGKWLAVAGYPKVDLAKYKVITTDKTNETFDRGAESSPIKLR